MRHGWISFAIVIGLAGVIALGVHFFPAARQTWRSVAKTIIPERSVRFVVVGDSHGVNPIYSQIIEELRTGDYEFLLHLADASEFGTADEFAAVQELESRLPFPVYHTVGNHDIKTDPTRDLFTEAFGQTAWGVDRIGDIRLIRLDNANRRIGFSGDQLDWLEAELTKATDVFTILAYHRPFDLPLESLFGDDETAASRLTNDRLVQILQTHPVDYIFTSHVHTYLPYKLADIPAIVSGGGGDPAQTILGGAKNNYFHYLVVTLTGRNLKIEVRPVTLTE